MKYLFGRLMSKIELIMRGIFFQRFQGPIEISLNYLRACHHLISSMDKFLFEITNQKSV